MAVKGTFVTPKSIFRQTLDLPSLNKQQGHKYNHGHALVLSGGAGCTGAARLAARAALRIGAGAVTLASPPDAMAEAAARLTAVMLTCISDDIALGQTLSDTRLNALCLGPGMGTTNKQARLIEAALRSRRPCVLDADALTLIAAEGKLRDLLHNQCVLTPHGGEFARLFPKLVQSDMIKPSQTLQAAQNTGAVVLYKGVDTFIATPTGAVFHHSAVDDRAVPWLATAGAGDVLAGLITGLLARGFAPVDAAQFGAWLHVECALFCGPGLIAEDLPEALPTVLRAIL